MKFAIALIGLVSLAGCGVAAKIDPRADYQKSIDDEYRACINDNLKNVDKCQAKRLLMEANERPPNNVAAGIAQRSNTIRMVRDNPNLRTTGHRALGTTAIWQFDDAQHAPIQPRRFRFHARFTDCRSGHDNRRLAAQELDDLTQRV